MQTSPFSEGSLRSKLLIETAELAQMLEKGSSNLRIINATWFMPNDPRNAKKEHAEGRITKDTQFFDIDAITLPGSNLPHTFPPVEVFREAMNQMRLAPNHEIVCYDAQGMFSVARAFFMLQYFGAQNVRILNGGLKKWNLESRPLVDGEQ
jgi:thiosulfate/3-mercaptopyruvate sulfurtransferase